MLTRRRALGALGAAAGAVTAAACGDSPTSPSSTTTTSTTTTTTTSSNSVCAVTPSETAGPYPSRADFVRSDIREDRQGTALTLHRHGAPKHSRLRQFSNWSARR